MNYDEKFDRPVFAERNRQGEVQMKGKPRATIFYNEGLDLNSHPADWADTFFPIHEAKRKSSRIPHHLLVEKICK
jgi:hypothetical protein